MAWLGEVVEKPTIVRIRTMVGHSQFGKKLFGHT